MAFALAYGNGEGESVKRIPKRPANQEWLTVVWPYKLDRRDRKSINEAAERLRDFARFREINIHGLRFIDGILAADFVKPRNRRGVLSRTVTHKKISLIVQYKPVLPAKEKDNGSSKAQTPQDRGSRPKANRGRSKADLRPQGSQGNGKLARRPKGSRPKASR